MRVGSRAAMRRTIFLYDDGIVLCATVRALDELGILDRSGEGGSSLLDLYPDITPSGFGYMRAGLRSLAAQGWLESEPTLDPGTTLVDWTESGRMAAGYRDHYVALGRFLSGFSSNETSAWSQPWEGARAGAFLELLEMALARWPVAGDPPQDLRDVLTPHLDAALAVPVLMVLRDTGRLGDAGPSLGGDGLDRGMARLLRALGWLDEAGRWSELGRHARDYAVHFGIVASYMPLLSRLPELYRGVLTVGPSGSESAEWHVNRKLNVAASAAAHTRYFADADEIFLELFDREPVEAQPRFIADMGCGDGSWLIHLWDLIGARTRRGRELESNPLTMVGIDFNEVALESARQRLQEAKVPGLLLLGDISDPESLRSDLVAHGLRIEDGLHIRSFLDHDRTYTGGQPNAPVPGSSSGAYVDPRGHALAGAEVEGDLVAHLSKWAPCVSEHGLIALEAHCVAPSVAEKHRGALHSIAFDAYHAYSHQYPVEYSAFMQATRAAGLERLTHCERHYPSSRPFTAVSLNRFVTARERPLPALTPDEPREDTWRPDPAEDLEDGRGLHELLFLKGDIRYPRLWCSPATGFVVAGALEAIEAQLDGIGEGDAIRVFDYGAGTGLAAIELLKASRERGIDRRLERSGATLELHLADLPSSWFAQGFELLHDCAWTRFHSLRGEDLSFRPLAEVVGGETMDVVMANMVFHLIPPEAMARVAADLARVMAPGGRLLWNSPDLAPAGEYAVLFHDPNRALRARWLELLGERGSPNGLPAVRRAVKLVDAEVGPEAMRLAQERADRRILPSPNHASDVEAALGEHLDGRIESRTYEMLNDEIVDALLVPANQGEYLPEIGDPALRQEVITELMRSEVLPTLQRSDAGTSLGLNVQWTLGDFVKSASAER